MQKISSATWSSTKLAVVSTDRIVQLYDEHGEKQDRFSTKPGEKETKSFVVKELEFSPDSTKLAIAQSDNIVFVYKLGTEWKERKSICNKFPQSSSVTCLCWPSKHPNEVVFGLAEGKVKVGLLKVNKAALLYQTDSFVTCMAPGMEGNSVISGHLDGSIHKFTFETENSGPLTQKFVRIPNLSGGITSIGWGVGVCAAGNDNIVRFWGNDGRETRTFDYSNTPGVKEFSCCRFNPSGESVVLGNYNKYFVFSYNPRTREWSEVVIKEIPNLYTISTLCWRADGSRLLMGTLCGSVEMFDACIKRVRYKGLYEYTYISLSQVIVKNLNTGSRIVLKSNVGYEIKKINVFRERYLVAHTSESLLLGDLVSCKLSEIPWNHGNNNAIGNGMGMNNTFGGMGGTMGGQNNAEEVKEKFFFDNALVCMIFRAGELSIVEYGMNEVLGCARTEYMSPNLVSIIVGSQSLNYNINALNNPQAQANALGLVEQQNSGLANSGNGQAKDDQIRCIAYLLDVQTIRIVNLATQQIMATINHDTKIEWLCLNPAANRILFRDKRRQLHLYNITDQTRNTLLNYCNFVKWVPCSDVVVAQNREQLCVWYSAAEAHDRVTLHEIKGDIESVERSNGRTFVTVDEGVSTVEYELDEALINFGSCLERKNYGAAIDILEELPLTSETEAMWRSLAKVAVDDFSALPVVEQCYAVLGDVSKARYIHNVNRILEENNWTPESGQQPPYMAVAKMAMLSKQFTKAEAVLLEQNQLEEAMSFYQELHRYDDSIRLAEKKSHPNVFQLKSHYLTWLISTQQEEKAGILQEKEGNYSRAIELYLKGGMAARAASVVQRYANQNYSQELLQRIAQALENANIPDKAGALYERMGLLDRAMQAYCSGNAYRQAVELAKQSNPQLVVRLEEEWGDYLSSQKQVDAAINHYIEAGVSSKAIGAAIASRQWNKAEQLLESTNTDTATALPFYEKLAGFYEKSRQFEQAERSYLKAGKPQRAVIMYIDHQLYDKANRVSQNHLSQRERTDLYLNLANKAENSGSSGKLQEAEVLYLAVDNQDLAINMYKKAELFEDMLRLVSKYRNELLQDTYKYIAERFQEKGNLKRAEHYYAEAKSWTSAVSMYRQLERWDDAKRVAKTHGGKSAYEKAVLAQAHSVFKDSGAEAGAQLLAKHGLTTIAIDYALEHNNFTHAFELAQLANLPEKTKEVHLKKALHFEDEESFPEAEEEFLKAGKPKEAVDMWLHQRQFLNAMRIAEQYDPASKQGVMLEQAKYIVSDQAISEQQMRQAESLFIQAKHPQEAVQMYSSRNMINDAIRVCKKHLPHALGDLVDNNGNMNNIATLGENFGKKTNSNSGSRGNSRSPEQGSRKVGGDLSMKGTGAKAGDPSQVEEILDRARVYEETNNFARAIDTYLMVHSSMMDNKSRLEEIWESAIRLAVKYYGNSNSPGGTGDSSKYQQICLDVGKRLNSIGRYESAGQLLLEADQPRLSCEAYMSAQQWSKATQIAKTHAPDLVAVIESRYKSNLMQSGEAEDLLRKTGDVNTALDMYARQGEWNKVYALAEKQKTGNPQLIHHYLIQNVKLLCVQGQEEFAQNNGTVTKFLEAAKLLIRYGAPQASSQTTPLYTIIAQKTLHSNDIFSIKNPNVKAIQNLRDMLFMIIMNRGVANSDDESAPAPMSIADIIQSDSDLVKYLLIAHFSYMRCINKELVNSGMGGSVKTIVARTSESLLRYTSHLPVDREFYLTGYECKQAENVGSAFLYLNRFLDILDAVEDENMNIEAGEFEETDIPQPQDIEIPEKLFLQEDRIEEVRELVLGWSVSPTISQTLPRVPCDNCGKQMYSGALRCHHCSFRYVPCAVTGQPVMKSQRVSCSHCSISANRDDWGHYVGKYGTCPWCNKRQQGTIFKKY